MLEVLIHECEVNELMILIEAQKENLLKYFYSLNCVAL